MTSPAISPRVHATFAEAAAVLRPPPKLSVTECAEAKRRMSSETSAEGGGRYRSARAPYQREMQDAILDPAIEQVVLFTAAQMTKSTVLENIFLYFATEDPCAIIWMWQTLDRAKEWAPNDLAALIRDTPALANQVEIGARKSAGKMLFKKFPGGSLSVIGANSPGGLRAKRARVILCDEVDAYPASAGAEGDPISLVAKRQVTFWNRKRVLASTCTIKGASRIEAAYLDSDQRKFYVPCPHCSEHAGHLDGFQVLDWKRLLYPRDLEPTADNVVYPCKECGVELTEIDKPWMLARGEWRKENLEPRVRHVAGFWINELYSPFVEWYRMALNWQEATRQRGNQQLLKTFVNLSLAQTWVDDGWVVDATELMERREEYPPPALPAGVTVVTCGVDVQADRLELEVVGWGKGEESWSIEFLQFVGDTSGIQPTRTPGGTLLESPWLRLEKYLTETRFPHAWGIRLDIAATFVDSGHHAHVVYAFTKKLQDAGLRCYASKGVSGFARPAIGKVSRQSRNKVKLFPVGVDVLKETTYARLRIKDPGAGYMHFSKSKNDADFFAQLTAEELKPKYVRGFPMRVWTLPPGKRNEALDCRVYATAAFLSLSANPARMLEALRRDLVERAQYAKEERRSKTPAGQLPLLDVEVKPEAPPIAVAVPEPETPSPVAAIAETAAKLAEVPGEVVEDATAEFDQEYKLAETESEEVEESRPAPPARGRGWR